MDQVKGYLQVGDLTSAADASRPAAKEANAQGRCKTSFSLQHAAGSTTPVHSRWLDSCYLLLRSHLMPAHLWGTHITGTSAVLSLTTPCRTGITWLA